MRSSRPLALLVAALTLAHAATAAATGPPLCQTDCASAVPLSAGSLPFGITRGPLGSMWFARNDALARIDHRGQITTYPVPTPDPGLCWVLADPRGVVWFTESDKIGRITPRGTITE